MDHQEIIRKAHNYEEESKWDAAAMEYCKAIQNDDSSFLYEKAAWCLSRSGKYSEAIKYLLVLCERDPHKAKWPYMVGYQKYCQKDWGEAAFWFERALTENQNYFVVKYRLAYAYYQLSGDYKKLTKPEFWKALGHLKDCHKLWGQYSEAQRDKERSTYFDVCFLHGKMLMGLESQRTEAISLFQRALEIRADSVCLYNLAKTYYLEGDYLEAKQVLPSGNQFYIIELDAYLDAKLGKYDIAIGKIEKLLKTRRKDYLFSFLAEVYLKTDRLDKAYEMIEEAILLNNGNHLNFFEKAKILNKYGLWYAALDALKKAEQIKRMKYDHGDTKFDILMTEINAHITNGYTDDLTLLEQLSRKNKELNNERICGTISKYFSLRGFGFIKSNVSDIFFHITECQYENINIGDQVSFRVIKTEKGNNAVDVRKSTQHM